MNIYEAIGMAWVIFSAALATVTILYLAFVGMKVMINKAHDAKDTDVPVQVKEMFKIAR